MTVRDLSRRLVLLERTNTTPRRVFRVVCPAGGPAPEFAQAPHGERARIADLEGRDDVLVIKRLIVNPYAKRLGGPDD